MNIDLVTQDDLSEWLGYSQQSKIERWLIESKIPYKKGKGGIVTTARQINNAFAGNQQREVAFK